MAQKVGIAEPPAKNFTTQDLEALLDQSRKRGISLWKLLDERQVPEDLVADLFAQLLKIPRVPLASFASDPEALRAVSEELARKYLCLPLKVEGKFLMLAMAIPADYNALQDVQFTSGLNVRPAVASRTEIGDGIEQRYSMGSRLQDFLANVSDTSGIEVVATESEAVDPAGMTAQGAAELPPVVKMCNLILHEAAKARASDIHIEPGLNAMQVRFRVDGVLREFMQMPKWVQNPAISRLKILAKLDISERRVPQDGRIKIAFENRTIDLRVSTLPTYFGEKVVMRLLGSSNIPSLGEMGYSDTQRSSIELALNQPQGMLLVTGPTGSGKSTSLYSMLKTRQSPEVNIVTVEDPIEYQLPGVNQVQVNVKAGLTFAKSLRSILRQDPDVILLGEIRDLETAEVAFQAAMTGHLVLSTLHTNSAAATLARLLDLGVDPFQLTSSLCLVVAQRLGRRICPNCRETYAPPPEMLERVQLQPGEATYFHGRGCTSCNQSGYSGRTGFYELLQLTPRLKELIVRKASEAEIIKAARQEGMQFLLDDARSKVKEGITTVEDVLRVVQIEEASARRCPECKAFLDPNFSACPYCMHVLKRQCAACSQHLKPEWRLCPYCNTPTGVTAPAEQLRAASSPAGLVKEKLEGVAKASSPAAPEGNAAAKSAMPPDGIAGAEAQQKHWRVLVVDDDRSMKLLIKKALEKVPAPMDIEMASDGVEALACIEKQAPDLVITDVMMPRMDGFALCERLRADIRTAFVPIIILTGNADEDSRTKGYLIGTDDYITKPFTIPELNARVMRLLRRTYGV
jgi:type IV pilus assembly protein PilB